MLTFYGIPLNTVGQCINLLSLVKAFDRRHTFLQQHRVQHGHDTEAPAPYPNRMWLCIAVNSTIAIRSKLENYLLKSKKKLV